LHGSPIAHFCDLHPSGRGIFTRFSSTAWVLHPFGCLRVHRRGLFFFFAGPPPTLPPDPFACPKQASWEAPWCLFPPSLSLPLAGSGTATHSTICTVPTTVPTTVQACALHPQPPAAPSHDTVDFVLYLYPYPHLPPVACFLLAAAFLRKGSQSVFAGRLCKPKSNTSFSTTPPARSSLPLAERCCC
jgi:hypothetical protein